MPAASAAATVKGFMTEPGSKRSETARSRRASTSRLAVVVRVVARARREREDLARVRVDDHDRRALGLVGPLRGVELLLGDVLDALVDGQGDVVALERLLVARPLAKMSRPLRSRRPFTSSTWPREILVERELEAVLALAVGRDEAEDRPRELAPGVVAVPFSFDREAVDGHGLLLRVAELAHGSRLVARDASLDPDEALPAARACA